jgi:prolyl-tRNA synthetase
MLLPEDDLCREAEHVAGFSPEVAWITETGGLNAQDIEGENGRILCKLDRLYI